MNIEETKECDRCGLELDGHDCDFREQIDLELSDLAPLVVEVLGRLRALEQRLV